MTGKISCVQKRCLLIMPLSFYSFHKTISEGLVKRGFAVDVLNDEFPANSFGKALGKFALPLLRRLTLRGIKSRLEDRGHYDLVLIIKGRGLGPAALAYLRTRTHRIVGYNFDSFRFNPSPLDWYHLADRYATFDIRDAENMNIPLVHLFSAATVPFREERSYDVSIIQRVHSDRLMYADLFIQALPADASSFIFLYESSLLTFVLGFLSQPRLYVRLWPYIVFKPLSYEEAMDALSRSRITFDYAHPKQSGITIRCFEAQSLGVAVLTNNPLVVDNGHFSLGSTAYFSKNDRAGCLEQQIAALLLCAPEPCGRSLDDFINDLLADATPLGE